MDITAPYCANLQFVKSYSNQGEQTSYVEGTADNRKVNARAISLKPCSVLRHWGLDGLNCVLADDEALQI